LHLRRELLAQKISELSEAMKEGASENTQDHLQDIVDYISLKKVLSEKLRRVL